MNTLLVISNLSTKKPAAATNLMAEFTFKNFLAYD